MPLDTRSDLNHDRFIGVRELSPLHFRVAFCGGLTTLSSLWSIPFDHSDWYCNEAGTVVDELHSGVLEGRIAVRIERASR